MQSLRRSPLQLDVASVSPPYVIAIDGDHGAGKTKLAKELSRLVPCTTIHVDDYCEGHSKPYLELVHWERLSQALRGCQSSILILESVLLDYILEKVEIIPTYRIFMKRIEYGQWPYSHYIQPKAKLPNSQLDREVSQYYRIRRPWEKANEEVSFNAV
ncbi:MAG: hypothetical protein WAW39_04360 [Prosthecobacter sp.]|uniref:hypothetical protein n=1 Tax=Prosthecobacter sp. TaxID=1965333 RepID=UPI003BAF9B97